MSAQSYYLRDVVEADLARLRAWRNHPKVRDFMYSRHEITAKEHEDWFRKNSLNPAKKFLLFLENETPQGFVNFNKQDCGTIAEWGFYVSPDAVKGSGTRMCRTALNYAFSEMKLHKVCGQVLAYNLPSIKLHGKLGFVEEGILRDQYFDGEHYVSTHCFGLLSSEWKLVKD